MAIYSERGAFMSVRSTRSIKQQIQRVRKYVKRNFDHLLPSLVGLLVIGVSLIVGFVGLLIGPRGFIDRFYSNVSPVLFSIGVMVLVADWLIRRHARLNEKARLTVQLGSPDSAFAVEAARLLRARHWGFGRDATLHEAFLYQANLPGANLEKVSLPGAHLWGANLAGATLREANLAGATLRDANLQGASLQGASLARANLWRANLQGANLQGANLHGTSLRRANLAGADLAEARFDEASTLPDDSNWTPGADLLRFTNPDRPGSSAEQGEGG
jgi:hypothetical protein